jgi:hypothetical protein
MEIPPEMTPEQVEEEEEEERRRAMDAARQQLPCSNCGSNNEPVLTKPERGTADWWVDPSVYIGCASCGTYLQLWPG